LARDDKAHTLVDAPYYIHGRAISGPPPSDSRELHHAAPAALPAVPVPPIDIEMIRESDGQTPTPELPTAPDIAPAAPTLETAENTDPTPTITAAEEVSAPTTEPSTAEEPTAQITEPQATTTISPPEVATADPAARTYPSRERRPPNRLTMHMTAKRALKEDPTTARPAIEAELRTLINKGVFRPVLTSTLTPAQRKGIIRSQLNVTQKYLPTTDGTGRIKDKVKARLVGGGDCQDRGLYSTAETSSPTIATTSIFLLAQIAAAEQRTVITLDIGSAYLNARMPKKDPNKLVFMRIAKEVSAIMTGVDKTFAPFINHDGTLVVELDRALYGCIESALLWHKELSSFLTRIGFTPNAQDICVLNRNDRAGKATIGIYVDDILLTCSSPSLADSIVQDLEDEYKQLKVTRGASHNYLGMVMDFSSAGLVNICQSGMVQEITRTPGIDLLTKTVGYIEEIPKTPCHDLLFRTTDDSPLLDPSLSKLVHSITAKILFVANRGRPDLLTFIAFMTKRVLHPTHEDGKKLLRALQYLTHTPDLSLTLGLKGAPTLSVYIDASFGVHQDRKSHSGVFTTMGRGATYTKSTTQKINTTSSCEAELVAISKGLQQSLWARSFLTHQGIVMPPLTVYQDNQSTVKLIERGRPAAEQTRHIEIGYFWLTDLLTRGIILIKYCPTNQMIADFYTKPLQGTLFSTMRNQIMGNVPITPP
jgi:Reverse transcriptase (RNA-dependent DNA polymerase)